MSNCQLDFSRLRRETWLKHVESHESIPSTNDRAISLAAETGLPCPALIIAERQTAGRGRGAHRWESGPGALTFSLILDRPTSLPRERTPLVSLVVGMATREAIAGVAPRAPVQVKWPNDVYLAGKKVAGILTEITTAAPDRLIVGIGINGNNSLENAPLEIQRRGISLVDHLKTLIEPTELLIRLLVELELGFVKLAETGTIDVDHWQAHCLLTGREISLRAGSLLHTGRCRGVNSDGALQLDNGDEVFSVYTGEVIHWP